MSTAPPARRRRGPTQAEQAAADGWQRVPMRLAAPGDTVRLHRASPTWTVIDVVRTRSGRDGTWRVTGWDDDGGWWDVTARRGSKIDILQIGLS